MKRVKFLLLSLLFMFLFPCVVSADASNPTCGEIRARYNEYLGVVNEYNSLVCDTPADTETYNRCSRLVVEKYNILQDIYTYSAKNNTCNISEVQTVLEENRDHCSNSLSSSMKDLSSKVMNMFYMLAPFLLIIFGSIDFFKIIVNGDPKNIQKNRSNFLKRVIAFILLYITPVLVNIILSLSVYDLGQDRYICSAEVSSPVASGTSGGASFNTSPAIITGVYGLDNSKASYDPGTSSSLLKAADSISKGWANQNYDYSVDVLVSGNIKGSINNPSRTTCCATLVSAALYQSGLITEEEINAIPYNGALYIAKLLDKKGWQIIDSYESLKAGDIVFMTSSSNVAVTLSNGRTYNEGHVQIYAGGDKWYNAGSDDSIKGSQPSTQSADYVKSRFSFAMRPTKSY